MNGSPRAFRRLHVLGAGTAIPHPQRTPAAVALELAGPPEPGAAALIDAGPGALHRLARAGIGLERLRDVLITHFHPDHTADLVALLFALKIPPFSALERPPRLRGPRGLRRLLDGFAAAWGDWVEPGGRIEVEELDPADSQGRSATSFELEGVSGQAWATRHAEGSVAYRFESRAGQTVAISGDTDVCPGVIEAGRGADVLLLECAFPEGRKVPGHLVPSEAGRIAREARPGRLVLTHLYPECDGRDLTAPVRAVWNGPVEVAHDGLVIDL